MSRLSRQHPTEMVNTMGMANTRRMGIRMMLNMTATPDIPQRAGSAERDLSADLVEAREADQEQMAVLANRQVPRCGHARNAASP
jgi:hypothetical protein